MIFLLNCWPPSGQQHCSTGTIITKEEERLRNYDKYPRSPLRTNKFSCESYTSWDGSEDAHASTRTRPHTQKWPVMDKHCGHEAAVDEFQELIRKPLIMAEVKTLVFKLWCKTITVIIPLLHSSPFCVFYWRVIQLQFLTVIFYRHVRPPFPFPSMWTLTFTATSSVSEGLICRLVGCS